MIQVKISADQEISQAATDFAKYLVHAVMSLADAQGKTVSMEVVIPEGDWPFGDHPRMCMTGLGGAIEIRRGLEGPSFPAWNEAPKDPRTADLFEPG